MKQYLQIPKVQIIIILSLFFVVTSSIIGLPKAIYLILTCVGFCVIADIIFAYLKSKRVFTKPFAAVVSGLILTLVIDPSATLYQILTICASSMAIKNFFRIQNRHILNPAASGLVVGWGLFGLQPSWWAATPYSMDKIFLNVLIYLLLGAIAYVSCLKVGRYNSALSYMIVYSVLFLMISSPISLQAFIRTMTSIGTLFFALLMLPEPMTSPVNKIRQIIYGSMVGVFNAMFVYFAFNQGVTNLLDPSIMALLIGNIIFFKFR